MDTLAIAEEPGGLYRVLLPPCEASVLAKLLDPVVPYVWLLDLRIEGLAAWLEQQAPPLFGSALPTGSILVRNLEFDVSITTLDFFAVLASFAGRGIDLIPAHREMPKGLLLRGIKSAARPRVYRELGVVFQFFLPHPHENALITSVSREVVEDLVSHCCA